MAENGLLEPFSRDGLAFASGWKSVRAPMARLYPIATVRRVASNRPGLDENEECTLAPLKAIRRQPYVHLNGRVESYSASE
jgi:hypothetical protein